MRWTFSLALALLLVGADAAAQQRDTRGAAAIAVATYNAGATFRIIGSYDLPDGQVVDGTVAVLNGPVLIAGRITGTLVAINADVQLLAGARIGRDLVVIGGTIRRDEGAAIGGEIRTQAELLQYTLDGDRIEPVESVPGEWRPRLGRGMWEERGDSYTELFFVAVRTYNRVEGLPVLMGPRFRRPTPWGRVEVEALGVVRTAGPIRWDRGTIGHDARATVRVGVDYGLVLSGRLFDVIEPVESWQLKESEAGVSTFLLHRDLRDHYGRHGVEGAAGGRIGEEVSLNVVFGTEQWRAVPARHPFSLFGDTDPWRVNPGMDVGRVDLLGVRLLVDTRERLRSPWTGGWFVKADLERGRGTIARDTGSVAGQLDTPAPVNYTRGFFDARRYNRLSSGTALNLRLVTGGRLGGDPLPNQRRLSVGGPGAIEGYDFRRAAHDTDVFTCGGIADREGRPALCDRVALAQLELRQEFSFGMVRTDHEDEWWRLGINTRGAWVLFADAGRGWRVDAGDPGIRHDAGIPDLSSFRTTLGGGVDFGALGLYVAKATSTPKEPVNFYVRIGRRF
ncbi:MAG: hypothetical protein WD771_08940 [Gemmatimonadaceae bacterium]